MIDKIVKVPIDKLIPYAGNPRKNDHAVSEASAIIKRFGLWVPVLIKSDNEIIDGHLRVKAAKKLGLREVPCIVVDGLSESEIKALRIAINKMAEKADWDEELLRIELEGLRDVNFDINLIGFSDIELTGILDGQESDVYQDWEDDSETPDYDGSPKGEGGTIIVHFPSTEDREAFFSKLGIPETEGKFCWFPFKP